MTDFYVTQAISGHNCGKEYLKRFGISNSGICDTCPGKADNERHRIYDCNRYEEHRREFQTAIEEKGYHWPITLTAAPNNDNFLKFKSFVSNIFNN